MTGKRFWFIAISSLAVLLAVVVVAVVLSVRGCCGDDADKSAKNDEYRFRPMLIVETYIAAIEKPTGATVLLADAESDELAPFFAHAGLLVTSNAVETSESFDVVMLTGPKSDKQLAAASERVATSGVLAWRFSTKGLSVEEFRRRLDSMPCESIHLWMPGLEEWMLVGRAQERRIKLDAMLEVFARDEAFEDLAAAQATAMSDIFASYVGTEEDVRGAFAADDLSVEVRPEFFLTKEIPNLNWISRGEIDEDVRKQTLGEIRSMQVIRRLIVEGNMLVDQGKTQEAIDAWARAELRNPRDPVLMERLDRLGRNAGVFMRLGNFNAAAQCYETMIIIRPTDAATVFNYGICLKRLGKKEMAEQVFKRAEALRK